MKKSTLVRVTTNIRANIIEDVSTLYISDECYTTWIDFEQLQGDILKDAYLVLANEVLQCNGLFDREVSPSCITYKIREYFLIRIVLLLREAFSRRQYSNTAAEFGIGRIVVGRPKSTSVRNLMLLKYQAPQIPGEPLYEVHSG